MARICSEFIGSSSLEFNQIAFQPSFPRSKCFQSLPPGDGNSIFIDVLKPRRSQKFPPVWCSIIWQGRVLCYKIISVIESRVSRCVCLSSREKSSALHFTTMGKVYGTLKFSSLARVSLASLDFLLRDRARHIMSLKNLKVINLAGESNLTHGLSSN